MKKIALVGLAMLVGMTSPAAQARKPKAAIEAVDDYVNKDLADAANVWHCWYDGATAVLCRLGEVVEASGGEAPQAAASAPHLPEFARKVWQQAAELADRVVAIPLHTTPVDMALTGQLAEAVMCGGSSRPCGVIFARQEALLPDLVGRRNVQLAARRLGHLAMAR